MQTWWAVWSIWLAANPRTLVLVLAATALVMAYEEVLERQAARYERRRADLGQT